MPLKEVVAKHGRIILALLLLPPLANALSFILNPDPSLQLSLIGLQMKPGFISGPPGWVDPSVGYIIQPIGYLAASDWLHGVIPWWNPFAGIGMPLAAESQTEALFMPFVLLLHFSKGWLVLRIVLQQLCGLFFYIFLKRIGLARSAAFAGSMLFELTPEFFLCPSAPVAPLPFLPLLLIGIENAAGAATRAKPLGWSLIVIACAYSLYAGNPEVAYFNGLLCALWVCWHLYRMSNITRLRFVRKLVTGIFVALCLSAPLLIPALEYTAQSYLGPHSGYFRTAHLPNTLIPLQIFPHFYGPLGAPLPTALNQTLDITRLPGWVSLPVLTLALASVLRSKSVPRFGLRLLLIGWILLWEARYLDFLPVRAALNLFPGLAVMDSARYSGPSVDAAFILLAAFALDDFVRLPRLSGNRFLIIMLCLVVFSFAAIFPGISMAVRAYQLEPDRMAFSLLEIVASVSLTVGTLFALRRSGYSVQILFCTLVLPLIWFVLPQLAGLRGGILDKPLISFLEQHTGTYRIASFGPLGLNFPDRYKIATINYNALPSPLLWANEVHASLAPGSDLNSFDNNETQDTRLSYLPAYAAAGVKYVLVRPSIDLLSIGYATVQASSHNQAQPLSAGSSVSGGFTGLPPLQTIDAISVLLGTYHGNADGPLLVSLCAGPSNCVEASADLQQASDNEPLLLTFPHPLSVNGKYLTYHIFHARGRDVALWLAPDARGQEQPILNLLPPLPAPLKTLVYHDQKAFVFELSNPADYVEADGCKLTIVSRARIQAACSIPTIMLRREMFAPGWRAEINGHPAIVTQSGLYQTVMLPAGISHIAFSYAPPHILAAYILALLGLLAWLTGVVAGRRHYLRESLH